MLTFGQSEVGLVVKCPSSTMMTKAGGDCDNYCSIFFLFFKIFRFLDLCGVSLCPAYRLEPFWLIDFEGNTVIPKHSLQTEKSVT